MANHGQFAIGATLDAALELAHDVEILAEQYLKVMLLGAVHIIPATEMKIVIEKFKTYGQRGQG